VPAECPQGKYDWLVGTDVNQLPTDQVPENRRVMDHTMSYTQEYIEGRLNVIYDKDSGKVTRVFCG